MSTQDDDQYKKTEKKRQQWQDDYLDAVDLSEAHAKQLEDIEEPDTVTDAAEDE